MPMKTANKLTTYLLVGAFSIITCTAIGCTAQQAKAINGEAEFKQHCNACHAGGGNSINPAKTLSKMDREKSGMNSAKELIGIMRKPPAGMPAFDEKSLSETDAEKIADYILNTFK